MLVAGDYIEYAYKGEFHYEEFRYAIYPVVFGCIRFPTEKERDPDFESVWEDFHEEDSYPAIADMLDRMGISALDGKSGFVYVDELGYVECLGELGDDGKRYCTLALPVDGVLCIHPARPYRATG